jgi:hypothetical protein
MGEGDLREMPQIHSITINTSLWEPATVLVNGAPLKEPLATYLRRDLRAAHEAGELRPEDACEWAERWLERQWESAFSG